MSELESYRELSGFEVYDERSAQQVLDARSGALVRTLAGAVVLNRPALALLVDVSGGAVRRRGVMLAYRAQDQRVAIAVAPQSCPPEKRLELVQAGAPQRARDRLVSASWPAAVRAREFFDLHDLMRTSAGIRIPADLLDGMLVFAAARLVRRTPVEVRG